MTWWWWWRWLRKKPQSSHQSGWVSLFLPCLLPPAGQCLVKRWGQKCASFASHADWKGNAAPWRRVTYSSTTIRREAQNLQIKRSCLWLSDTFRVVSSPSVCVLSLSVTVFRIIAGRTKYLNQMINSYLWDDITNKSDVHHLFVCTAWFDCNFLICTVMLK